MQSWTKFVLIIQIRFQKKNNQGSFVFRSRLWLVFQCSYSVVKLFGDSLQIAITVLDDDGYIQLLPLEGGMRSANGEAVGTGCLLEPAYEEPVAASLTMVC